MNETTQVRNAAERWIVDTYALWLEYAGGSWQRIGGFQKNEDNAAAFQKILEQDWGIKNREEGLEQVGLLSARASHNHPETDGWDYCRAMQLLGIFYIVGYMNREEMLSRGCEIGSLMQERYHSWEELCASYLADHALWCSRVFGAHEAEERSSQRQALYSRMKEQTDGPYKVPWNLNLHPYYKKALEQGTETEDSACELMTNLWLKTFTINKIRSWSHTQFSAGSPLYQNVTVGGQTPDKRDAVNPMTYLILKSVAQTRLPQPNLTVRYHSGLEDHFMKECIEVVRLGFGMPAFTNDEIIIPSFIEKGVKEEDAYNYSAIGCVETAVPGKWGYRCTGMSFLNFPKSLLIAMNDGVDPESGVRLCEGVGHFTKMKSYDEVGRAWDRIIRDFTKHSVVIETCCDMVLEETVPDVLCSCLVEDCIGRGKTLKEGGAVYDFISGLQVGIANMADSLAAIKKCVFEDRSMAMTTTTWIG